MLTFPDLVRVKFLARGLDADAYEVRVERHKLPGDTHPTETRVSIFDAARCRLNWAARRYNFEDPPALAVGAAKRNPADPFCRATGRRYALDRAFRMFEQDHGPERTPEGLAVARAYVERIAYAKRTAW